MPTACLEQKAGGGGWAGCIPRGGVSTILEMGKIEVLGMSHLPRIIHPISGQSGPKSL